MEFRSENNKRNHVRNVHEIEMEPCEFCGKVLKKGLQMRRHKRRNHTEKKFGCKFCDMKFKFIEDLKVHENRHEGKKTHKCQYCDESYYVYKKLTSHINIVHKKQKFVCLIPKCSSVFRNKTNYRVHIKNVHKELSADEMTTILERITLLKPTFRLNNDEIGQSDDNDEAPKKKRGKQKTFK